MKPLELTLEFTRSSNEPFQWGEQQYLHRKETGRFQGASLTWGEELLMDLAELGKPEPNRDAVHRLGELLRGFLNPVGWESYEARIQEALHANQPVFLSLQFDADELYALPWELLTLGGSGQPLAELPGLSLRYEWPGTRTVPLDPDPPKGARILYAWSSAGGPVPSEKQGQALRQACAQGGVAFVPPRDVLANASARTLAAALKAHEPVAVLHLLCHGAQRQPNSLGLMLDSFRPGGEPEFIDGKALAGILAPHARTLRLVVLSACQSGATGMPGSTLPGVARALHQAGIQCVVASRLPLSVEGAVEMTETLYGELLGTPCSLEQALGLARIRLRHTPTRLDWASLQLYARAADGTDTRPLALQPYRGLLAFQPEHSRFFFGRGPLQEELLNRVDESHLTQRLHEASTHRRHRFQVVAGASGSGKSSLVLAGLVAQMDKRLWDVVVTRPVEGGGFAAAKSGVRSRGWEPDCGNGTSPEPGGALLTLWKTLRQQWAPLEATNGVTAISPAEILEEAARMRQARPDRRLLLVVDQFEEVFTQVSSLAEREAYVGALWALAERQELEIIVLSTLRVDYFGRCGELNVDASGKRLDTVVYSDEHRMFVTQLQGEQLQAIIEGPALKVGLVLDEGLVEVLRRDVGTEPGALPLLEYALDQLWERRVGNRLTHKAYEEIGGVGGALTGAANRLLATFSPEEQRVARQLLVELVDFTDNASPNTRRRGWLVQLRPSGGTEQELFDRVLARLVGARLLVKGGDGSTASEAGIWVEVAHESLIRRWETLTRWIHADRKAAQERRELRMLAEKWKANLDAPDKGSSFLLVGYRLEAARQLQQEYGGQLAQHLHQFIDESWRHATTKRRAARRRIASLLTTSVVVAVLMTALMVLAKHREQEATQKTRIAHDLSRIAVAQGKLKTNPTTSLLFLRDVENPEHSQTWISDVRNVLDEPLSHAVLKGHTDGVNWVDFSHDSQRIATGSQDGTARVWDLQGKQLLEFRHGKQPVLRAAFGPNDAWLVTYTQDGRAHVHSLRESQARPSPFQEDLRAVAFSMNGEWVATVALDNIVKLWRWPEASAPSYQFPASPTPIKQVAFSPASTHVLAVAQDQVRVWQVDGQGQPVELSIPGITSATLSPDGTHMAVALSGTRAKVLRVSDGETLWKSCGDGTTHAEFNSKGTQVLVASEDLVAQARRLNDGSCTLPKLKGHTSDIQRATFSPDGNWVLTASNDGTTRLWPVSGDDISSTALPMVLRGHRIGVTWAAFSPDGKYVVTGAKDKTARVWPLKRDPPFSLKFPHGNMVWTVAISANQWIASASNDGVVRIWSQSGDLLAALKGHTNIVRAVAFSPDNQWLVTGGTDETLRLWSLSRLTNTLLEEPIEPTHTVTTRDVVQKTVAFSPAKNELLLATGGSDGKVSLWKLQGSGKDTRLRQQDFPSTDKHTQGIRSISFSSTGHQLITASEDRTAIVWDVATGKRKHTLADHTDWVRSAAFSPNDDHLALTASQDGTARVWDLRKETPKAIHTAPHGVSVRWAAFSPDKKHFATAAVDGLIRVWPLKHGKEKPKPLFFVRGHEDEVTSIAYLDEARLVTSSIDGTVRLWKDIKPRTFDDLGVELKKKLDLATTACLDSKAWERNIGGEFPESSLKRYKACRKKHAPQSEPEPGESMEGGE